MNGYFKDKLIWIFTLCFLAVILISGLVLMYPNYRRSELLRQNIDELQAEIDAKKREIAKLKDNQRRFRTDPDFVEMIARQNHRMFSGELVFIFNDK